MLRTLFGIAICFSLPFFVGAKRVGSEISQTLVVGSNIPDCNVIDGQQFDYSPCTGSPD